MNSFRSAIQSGKGLHSDDPVVRSKKKRGAKETLGTVDVPRSEKRTHNHRDNDRHRLDEQEAVARFKNKKYPVTLINLSGGGAMIEAGFKPRLWQRVDLVFDEGSEIECAVRWLRDDRIGLEFAHETRIDCDPEARDALLLDVIRKSFPDVAFKHRPDESNAPATAPAANDKDDEPANSGRTERRHPLIWMGEIHYNHDSEKVRLRNISANGALIESPVRYPIGVELLLDLGEAGQHFATVSWTCADKTGLKFVKPFDLMQLGSAKPEVALDMWTRPGPSRQCADKDNPWANEWNRQSIDELREDLEGFLKR